MSLVPNQCALPRDAATATATVVAVKRVLAERMIFSPRAKLVVQVHPEVLARRFFLVPDLLTEPLLDIFPRLTFLRFVHLFVGRVSPEMLRVASRMAWPQILFVAPFQILLHLFVLVCPFTQYRLKAF